jgi:hypothetical protein
MLLGLFCFGRPSWIVEGLASVGKWVIMGLKDFGLSLVLFHASQEKRR